MKHVYKNKYYCLVLFLVTQVWSPVYAQCTQAAGYADATNGVINSSFRTCCQTLLDQTPADIASYTAQQKKDWWAARLACATKIYQNPYDFPNYLMIVAHRGYFRDVPENSLKSVQLAIELGVPMVELDVWKTKDGVMVCGHDKNIGGSLRTRVPNRLKSSQEYKDYGSILIKKLTLCELRPDLCNSDDYVGVGDYQKESTKSSNDPNKSDASLVSFSCDCDPYLAGDCTGNCEPSHGGMPEGNIQTPIATLQEAFAACKGKVLINLDKIDDYWFKLDDTKNCPTGRWQDCCPADDGPYGYIYEEALKAGVIVEDDPATTNIDESFSQVVVKGKPSKAPTAASLKTIFGNKGVPHIYVDWNLMMYTPTFFAETPVSNNILAAWVNEPDFYCTGFELQAQTSLDPLFQYIPYVKNTLKKHYIGFASYPEFCHHFYKDPRTNFDTSWDWYLDGGMNESPTDNITDNSRRCTLFITDRLEVLVNLVKQVGLSSTAQ